MYIYMYVSILYLHSPFGPHHSDFRGGKGIIKITLKMLWIERFNILGIWVRGLRE
jgi:hypothetical protein